ncbi:LysM peptidoglycan-binding domain-containing protein [Mucilaginibacter sp. SD-g]|uniref:LysM peptidoglycan-binding domain-containing protein n=2 Tax=Mucilaginibacter segetis TaxID=2793071 RepID=A0A934ULT1_9SPHI|nr:LysM peptidoglycan-binding domain-containing protein [Mucilaginibacter segetis]
MKLKTLLITSILISVSVFTYANTLVDSIGVENANGKKIILHKLDPKDNYYSIGRRYNVSPKDIMKYNNNVSLQIGHIIKVPTERPFFDTAAKNSTVAAPQQPVSIQKTVPAAATTTGSPDVVNNDAMLTQQYKVSAGETLYSIAKRFNSTVEDIKRINKLAGNNLTPGQVLRIRSGVTEAPPEVVHPTDSIIAKRDATYVDGADSIDHAVTPNRYGLYEKNEDGVATWITDTGLDPKKMLILHRTAPVGTVMKITNPMTNRTAFAKVVGSFIDTEQTKDVIIVMTKNVADALGALDKRFRVNISYGTANE